MDHRLASRARTRALWRGAIAAAIGWALVPVATAAPDSKPSRFDRVVIDAGHGGDDHGARGRGGLAEKELVLDVSKRLAERLRRGGVEVTLTRSDDRFVPLEVRTSVANDARGDLFISIHANSAHTAKPRGIETYFVSLESSDERASQVAARENQAFQQTGAGPVVEDPLVALLGDMIATEHLSESSVFAKLVQGELATIDAHASRGVKQAPFVVLMGVQMPASLIEIGFLSNPADEAALRDRRHREALVEAIARAVARYAERYDAKRGLAARSTIRSRD